MMKRGASVTLDQIEQGQFIIAALQGDFQAFLWAQHAGYDPILQWVWWDSETAVDPPQLALNFGRIRDDVIDENLHTIITSADEDERTRAAEAVNRRFGEQFYDLWIEWRLWGIAHSSAVHNVRGGSTAEGRPVLADEGGGLHQISQIWVER